MSAIRRSGKGGSRDGGKPTEVGNRSDAISRDGPVSEGEGNQDWDQEGPTAARQPNDDDEVVELGDSEILAEADSDPEMTAPPPDVMPSVAVPDPSHSYADGSPALRSYNTFRAETHRLARARDYRSIASLHEAALEHCPWAGAEDIHITLLVDLAKLYRDRIPDRARAQQVFERLIAKRPGHEEAMKFLSEVYESQSNMVALHNLYAKAVDEEWGPERRIELTRNAARIALDHLKDAKTAARDWERLLELGDMDGQVTVELSRVYREAERWTDLGEFLQNRAAACSGTTRVAILREAVEAFLAGASDATRAEGLIHQILEDSPDDPVALASLATLKARSGDWQQVAEIAARAMSEVPTPARLDVLRLSAGLLTDAGEHDKAALAYERVLQVAPNDKTAVAAREEHLRRAGDHDGLVSFLVSRAEKARQSTDKGKLFARAAEAADKLLGDLAGAAALWTRSVAVAPDNATAYEALVALHDRLNDTNGITQALEGLVRVTRDSKSRAQVLRRLGEHYAYRANNDNDAQRCWLEVIAIDPDDLSVQRELNGIHRRRGDFAALDLALTRQLSRTTERDQAIDIAREIAQNLDENLAQPERTIRAWMHVLDLAPHDAEAMNVLSNKLADRRETTEVQGVLEARLSLACEAGDRAQQIEIGFQIAKNWEARNNRTAAIAAYERVRAWAPDSDEVLEALTRLHGKDAPGAAMSVLEIAAAQPGVERQRARGLLARSLPLIAENAPRSQFFLLRRLLRLRADQGLDDVVRAATTAGAWAEIASLYECLGRKASSSQERRECGTKLAEICEKHLNNPGRAYVAIQSLGLKAMNEQDCTALERLAEATGRWEDLLAVLDATIQESTAPEQAQPVLLRRAEICEKRLNDPHRAFLELQRFVETRGPGDLSESENAILAQMRRLAIDHKLMNELVSVYNSLWDLALNDAERVRFAREREVILRDHLEDSAGALEQGLLVLRMLPDSDDAANNVLTAADKLNAWERALPVLEGVWRASTPQPQRLVFLAKLYDERCGNTQSAVELLAEALRLDPNNVEAQAAVENLGEKGKCWPRIVQAERLAAARLPATPRGLELARKVAALFTERLGDSAASLEIHRWILQIWPNEMESLQVVIQAQRAAKEYPDLRTSLEQWIQRSSDMSTHVGSWLEAGRICAEQLHDPAGALVAFSHVMELEPSNEEAAEAIRGLADVSLPATLRRKRVRVELARATDQRKIELLAQLAALDQEMGDRDAAIAALREMLPLEGGRAAAFEPLSRLLRESASWADLASLFEDAAAPEQPTDVRLRHLRAALDVEEIHLDDPARSERLLRQILTLAPDDEDASIKLARILRNARRFDELAQMLSARLESTHARHDRFAARWMRRELVRIFDLALGRSKDAEAILRARPEGEHAPPDPDDALWLAMMAARKPDHATYLEQRRRHIAKLPKRLGALVLCHLAEYCDQYMKLKGRVLALYREARTLDPDNSLSMDALRGLGRGVRTWRSTAALLPIPDEESLSAKERSQKLRQSGDAAKGRDSSEALGWYERAVAVDPDDIASWDAIAEIALERRENDYAFLASAEACHAFERVTSPLESDVPSLARRLARSAEIARRAEHHDAARELAEIAFAVEPNVPSSAMLVADARFQAADSAGALALYSRILEGMTATLTPEQQCHALSRRGVLYLQTSELDKAHVDLKQALQLSPLLAPALDTMAELLKKQGQPASAALHLLKALLVTRDTPTRGRICRRLGDLFEIELARAEEAGAWFEAAVEAGVVDHTLKRRLLDHYRRTDRGQQALTALEDLIQATSEPSELADLWATRGSILAETDLDGAVEALDIALSYEPAHAGALSSLRTVLEQRGDYAQLADLLEARTESGTPQERVDALRSLIRICSDVLGDHARSEQYLLRLVEIQPSREAVEDLLRIVEANPQRQGERLGLIGRLLGSGPPYCERLIEAAKMIFERDDKHWTWAVLAALMGAAPVDAWTKTALAELRKIFERFDSVTLLRPFLPGAIGKLPEPDPFMAALTDVCSRLFLAKEDSSLPAVDPRTGPGKVFDRVLEGLDTQGRLLRSGEAAAPLSLLAGTPPTIAIRTDLLSAPPGELAYLCTYGMMAARAECIALASVPEEQRALLVPALALASAEGEPQIDDPAIAALVPRICEALSPDELAAWRKHLVDAPQAANHAMSIFNHVEKSALSVALVAAGDLRTATRAIARLSADGKRPPGVGRIEDFEHFFASMPQTADLFEFALSEDFGRLLRASA